MSFDNLNAASVGFGNGVTVVGSIGADHAGRAGHQSDRVRDRVNQARDRVERGHQRADRARRQAQGNPPEDRGTTFTGPTTFGAGSRAYGDGARAYGPGAEAYDGQGRRIHHSPLQPADRPQAPAGPVNPTGGQPRSTHLPADERPRAQRPSNTTSGATPAGSTRSTSPSGGARAGGAGSGSVGGHVGGEVIGLDQSIAYAQGLAGQAGDHGSAGNEGYIGHLQNSQVGGDTLQSAHDMQEAFSAAAAAAERHASELAKQKAVQEQYDANPDAGDKDFQQEGR